MGVPLYVGIDIGGTKGACSVFPSLTNTEALDTRIFPVTQLSDDPSQSELDLAFKTDYGRLTEACTKLADVYGQITGIGLALAGVPSKDRTHITSAGSVRHFVGRRIVPDLVHAYGCGVALGNDAEAAAMAEAAFGHGQESDFWFFIWGTGVGGTLVRYKDGNPLPCAGEPGHSRVDPFSDIRCGCGQLGCLETYTGGGQIPKRYGKPAAELTADEWQEVLHWMKIGVGSVICIQPTPLVVFGGGVACKQSHLLPDLESQLKKELKMVDAPRIELSAFGEAAGTVGAMTLLNMW